jgi:hypothetical protein
VQPATLAILERARRRGFPCAIHGSAWAGQLCQLCADICNACAGECERFDAEACQACASLPGLR